MKITNDTFIISGTLINFENSNPLVNVIRKACFLGTDECISTIGKEYT